MACDTRTVDTWTCERCGCIEDVYRQQASQQRLYPVGWGFVKATRRGPTYHVNSVICAECMQTALDALENAGFEVSE